VKTLTLADKLGTAPRPSPLLEKAKGLGLTSPESLEGLAVGRGCWHYGSPEMPPPLAVSEREFTNEELAIALLSPGLRYSPHTIRLGAAMLGATGNRTEVLSRLARAEGCETAVRYVAQAGRQFEPDNSFWSNLLIQLPATAEAIDGVFPHPTRFVSMTGFTRAGPGRVTVWIRPRPDLALAHG